MNNDFINDYLKKKIDDENIIVSPLVNTRIDETLSKLYTKKRRNPLFKKVAIAASITAVIIATSTILPVTASGIPIIGSVFQYFMGLNNNQNEVVSEYIKYSKGINQSVDKNGIKFTVDEVSCDINSLVISYTIQGKNKISINDDKFPSVIVNGKPIGSSFDMDDKNVGDNTIKGMFNMDISKNNLPDKFDLDFNIYNISSTKENWNFKFNVSKEASNKATKVYSPNVSSKLPIWNYTVNTITLSPFSNSISISGTSMNDLVKLPYEFFVLDNNNNVLTTKMADFSQLLENKNFKMCLEFIKGKDPIDSITLLPFTVKYSTTNDFVLSKALSELPAIIDIGNKGLITINSVKINDTNTIVNYAIDGYTFNPCPALVDEVGNKILPEGRAILVDASNREYQIEFPKIDKNKNYKVAAIKNPQIQLLEQNKLIIPLK
ncbi:MAG: DUF4179 domain-containing protein [Clostridium sp.]|uniref:DUF4179 domain-containing protein n=1 Tax=Clostridium sp. TaxID=1506 RepID=UPI003D6C7277